MIIIIHDRHDDHNNDRRYRYRSSVIGSTVNWFIGYLRFLVYWLIGLLVYWFVWFIGFLVYWLLGLLVYWSIGYWFIGAIVPPAGAAPCS